MLLMGRKRRWVLGAVMAIAALALIAGGGYGAYRWGTSQCEAAAAEAREQAVTQALQQARKRWRDALAKQKQRTAQYRDKARELEHDLAKAKERRDEYADSKPAQERCFGEAGREVFDEL